MFSSEKRGKALRTPTVALVSLLFLQNCLLAHATESNIWAMRMRPVVQTDASALIKQLPPLSATTLSAVTQARSASVDRRPFVERLVSALPANLGTVRRVTIPKNPTGQVVVHIQDVHMN